MNKMKRLFLFFLTLMLLGTYTNKIYANRKESKIYVTDDAHLLSSKENHINLLKRFMTDMQFVKKLPLLLRPCLRQRLAP